MFNENLPKDNKSLNSSDVRENFRALINDGIITKNLMNLRFVQSINVTGLANVPIINLTEDHYVLELVNLKLTNNATALTLVFSDDNGLSYSTGSNYAWDVHGVREGRTGQTKIAEYSTASTSIRLISNLQGTNEQSKIGHSGILHIRNLLHIGSWYTGVVGRIYGAYNGTYDDEVQEVMCIGQHINAIALTPPINAFMISLPSGVYYSSGEMRLYNYLGGVS